MYSKSCCNGSRQLVINPANLTRINVVVISMKAVDCEGDK